MSQYITAGDLQRLFPDGQCSNVWTKGHSGKTVVNTPVRSWTQEGEFITLKVDDRKGSFTLRDVRPAYSLTIGL